MLNQAIGQSYDEKIPAGGIFRAKTDALQAAGPLTESVHELEKLLSDIALKASRSVAYIYGPQNEDAGSDKDRRSGIVGRLADLIDTAARINATLSRVENL